MFLECMSAVQLLKLRARFLWRVGFKPLLGGRELFRAEGFVALARLTLASPAQPVNQDQL